MHEIQIGKRIFTLPASQEELLSEQWLPALMLSDHVPFAHHNRAVVLRYFLKDLPSKMWRKLTLEQLLELSKCILWMNKISLKGEDILPSFVLNGDEYISPGHSMKLASMIEYASADLHFDSICKINPNDNNYNVKMDLALSKLIAILYRPEKKYLDKSDPTWEGDPREIYNTEVIESRTKLFHKKLSFEKKQAVLIYYVGSVQAIVKRYAVLFETKEDVIKGIAGDIKDKKGLAALEHVYRDDTIQEWGKKKIKGEAPKFRWLGVIYTLAESGVFGDFDKVKHYFFHTVANFMAFKKYKENDFNL